MTIHDFHAMLPVGILFLILGTTMMTEAGIIPNVTNTDQRGRTLSQPSPRFIVIRPPGQGNRMIVLANPRFIPNARPETAERRFPARTSALSSLIPSTTRRGTNTAEQIRNEHQGRRHRAGAGAGVLINPGTPSLRGILQRRQSQGRSGMTPLSTSNIARSPTIPRALPPLTTNAKRFGELNMPTAIEMALDRLRLEAQRSSGGLRSPTFTNHASHAGGDTNAHFGNGVLDLSGVQTSRNRNSGGAASLSAASASRQEAKQSRVSATKTSQTISHTSSGTVQAVDNVISKTAEVSQSATTSANATKISDVKSQTSATDGGGISASAKVAVKIAAKATNTTTSSKKTVKSRTIKVTTVVKGNDPASVAAATASQKSLANAVAAGTLQTTTPRPVGSISVNRGPDGVSIITLSDGQGEPVILRARGPVKIERVISPSGRIQFVVNSMGPPGEEVEIEPEDMITTPAPRDGRKTPKPQAKIATAALSGQSTTSQIIPPPPTPTNTQIANLVGVQEHRPLAQSETSIVETVSSSVSGTKQSSNVKQAHAHVEAKTQVSTGNGGVITDVKSKSQSSQAKSQSHSTHAKSHSHNAHAQSQSQSALAQSQSQTAHAQSQSHSTHAKSQSHTAHAQSPSLTAHAQSQSHSAHAHQHSRSQQTARVQSSIAQSPLHDPEGILHPNEMAAIKRNRARQRQSQSKPQQTPGHHHRPAPLEQQVNSGSVSSTHEVARQETSISDTTNIHSHSASNIAEHHVKKAAGAHHVHGSQASHSNNEPGSQFPSHSHGPVSMASGRRDGVQPPSAMQSLHQHPEQFLPQALPKHSTMPDQSPRQQSQPGLSGSVGSIFPSAEELGRVLASNRSGVSAKEFLAALDAVHRVLAAINETTPTLNTETAKNRPQSKDIPASSIIGNNIQSPTPFAPTFSEATSKINTNQVRDSHRHVRHLDIAQQAIASHGSSHASRLGKHSGHSRTRGPS